MSNIDTSNHDILAGAVYFAVGRGTEGGSSSYHLSIAGVTSGISDPGWGDASNVATNSGYTFGTIQVDLGQRGTWPVGAANEGPLKAGEKTYVDAIIDQSSMYAKEHGLKYTGDLNQLRSDLLSHGDGQAGRSTISFIDKNTRDSINAWASSPEGKQWVHRNIDYPQVKAATETAVSMLDKYGKNIPEDRCFETVSLLAKTANQMPAQLPKYQDIMEKGGNYDDLLKEASNIKRHHSYYDGPKAAAVAEKYENIYNDPSKKDSLDRAHAKVSGPAYDPSKEGGDPDIKEALRSIKPSTHAHNQIAADILKQGMHNEQVQKLQTQLGELGYLDNTATPDGKFGPATAKAVRAFQHDHELTPGSVGPKTRQAIDADLAPLKQDRPGPLPAVSAMSSLPVGTPGLDDPRNVLNSDHALYNALKARIPDASENRLVQFTAACHANKITTENLGEIHFDRVNGQMKFDGGANLLATSAIVDLKAPSPEPQQSIQQIQQFDQNQAQVQTQIQAQNAQINQQGPQGPTLGGY